MFTVKTDAFSVGLSRRDWIQGEAVEVDPVEVYVECTADQLTVELAQELARLLIMAAEIAEQG